MNHNFTTEDLLRFFYKETSKEERLEIEKALKLDASLKVEYEKLLSTIENLNEIALEPSDTSLSIIMNYAKDQHPELQ